MAYSIKRSNISDEQTKIIRKLLYFIPKMKDSSFQDSSPVKSIGFYIVKNDIVHLPYLFASSLFQIIPNINISYPVINIEFTGKLRDYQIPVEEKSWEQMQQFGTSTLCVYPGFGKTILGAKLASRIKLLTVVLVNREILTVQWKKTFTDNTNTSVWVIGEKNPPSNYNIIICMNSRWDKIPEEIRDYVGFLIIDEAHSFCTAGNVECLLSFHPKYILIESASLERDDGMEQMMYSIVGKHGVFIKSQFSFQVYKVVTGVKPVREHSKQGKVKWDILVKTTLFNDRRNNIILNLILINIERKILVLTSLKEHSTLLYEVLKSRNISVDFLCGNRKSYTDSKILIGTTSKIGTGFDPATSCETYDGKPFDLLLLVCSMKKESMLIQNIGRIFRSDFPIVYHFVDDDTIYTSHWYIARKWYIARGGIIKDIKIPLNNVTQH